VKLGEYEVLEQIGRGATGTVLRARARDGREVALKLLGKNVRPDWLARFARERRLLAALGSKEGFVALLGSGDSPEGPYLIMPYLTGGTLRDRLKRGPLPIDAARALGLTLARAMAQAHAAGVVHRDLKPENILFDAEGRAFVADLGLAKHYDGASPGASQSVALSRTGELRGTPGYMAGEQMQDATTVGPSADVFALGAVLYECLAGRSAFQGMTMIELIGNVERGTFTPLRSLRPDVPRGLAGTIERALARDPAERHADAGALAAELDREERARAPVALLVVGAVLLAVTAGAAAFALRSRAQPVADVAAVATESVAKPKAPRGPFDPEPDVPPIFMDRSEIPPGYEVVLECRWARLLGMYGEYSAHASAGWGWVALSPDGKVVLADDGTGKLKLWDVASGRRIRTIAAASQSHGLAIAPDGRRALVGHTDGLVRLYDLATGAEIRSIGKHQGIVNCVRFSPDGRLAASVAEDAKMQLFDLEDQSWATFTGHEGGVFGIAFTPDGKRVLTSGTDGKLKLWDVAAIFAKKPALIRTFSGHNGWVFACAVSPDGRSGASAGVDGNARVFNLETGEETVLEGHGGSVTDIAFTPDGAHVVTSSFDRTLRIWDLATKEFRVLAGHTDSVIGVALSRDGRLAVSGSLDQTLRVWDLATAKETRTIREPDRRVNGLSFLPDGKSFVSANEDGEARLLGIKEHAQVRTFAGHGGAVLAIDTSKDGTRVVTGCEDGLVRVFDPAREKPLFALAGHKGPVRAVTVTADGARAASAGDDGTIHLWDLVHARDERTFVESLGPVLSVAISADGGHIVSGSQDAAVRIWSARTGELLDRETGHGAPVRALAIDPDGEHFLSGSDDTGIRLWQLAPPSHVQFPGGRGEITAVALFPDGKRFASLTAKGTLSLWRRDSTARAEVLDLRAKGLADRPISLAVSHDGTALLVGTEHGVVFHFRVD
jgi:WD40 repeat protein